MTRRPWHTCHDQLKGPFSMDTTPLGNAVATINLP
jgi:hypothetical protein